MSFGDELRNGFEELAREAGTDVALKWRGVVVVGVMDDGTDDPLKVDTKIGSARRCRLMVARAELAKAGAAPRVGDAFDYAGGKLSVKDVEDFDPTDPTVAFVVKFVAAS